VIKPYTQPHFLQPALNLFKRGEIRMLHLKYPEKIFGRKIAGHSAISPENTGNNIPVLTPDCLLL